MMLSQMNLHTCYEGFTNICLDVWVQQNAILDINSVSVTEENVMIHEIIINPSAL